MSQSVDLSTDHVEDWEQELAGLLTGTNARGAFLLAFPGPPWQCFKCGLPIMYTFDNDPDKTHRAEWLIVHHHDENKDNNHLSNLRSMHYKCHTSHHRKRTGGS